MASFAPSSSSVVKMEAFNPCCAMWRTRYSKMEEKRNALRQGVEILKGQIDRLQQENANLQRACDEERARLSNLKEEKEKEASLGISMKKEIAGFESELSQTKQEAVAERLDLEKEVFQLRSCISDREMEIDRLRQLLAEEVMKCDAEKNTVELERKKASELQKSLDYEKNKAGEAFKIADAASRKAEDHRLQFETLKNEYEKANLKLEEVNRIHEAEKQIAMKEKQNSVELRVKEEEHRANALLEQLEEEKQKVERLQKEMQEIMLSKRLIDSSELDEVKKKFEAEKQKVAREKRLVEEEMERVIEQRKIAEENEKIVSEERCRANAMTKQWEEEKQKVERLEKEMQEIMLSKKSVDAELDEVKRKFEVEKKKVAREKRLVEEEKERVVEHRQIAEINEKRFSEERSRADTLTKQLDEEQQMVERLQMEMQDIMLSKRSVDMTELDEVKRELESEKKKVAQGKRLFEEEKDRVLEQRRIVEEKEKMVSEERCRAETLAKQLEEENQMVERLQKEKHELLLSKRSIDLSELDKVKRKLEAEKKKVAREKRHVEQEKERVIEQQRISEMNEKRFVEERCHAEKLLLQLEEEKLKVEELQRKMQDMASQKSADFSELEELKRILEIEKEKAALGQRIVEEEKMKASEQKSIAEAKEKILFEEKGRADKLSMQLEVEKQKVEKLQKEMQVISLQKSASSSRLDEVHRNLEAEKNIVARDRSRGDMEKLNSEEQGNISEANKTRAIEEKKCCRNLLHELEDARQKLKNMGQELHEVKLRMGLVGTSVMSPAFVMNEQAARVNILQEQLKFERKRVKHAKEVAKLEKGRNNILQQELHKVKNDFQCLLDHLSMLSDIFGARNAPIYLPQKLGPPQMHFQGDEELRMSGLTSRDASCLQNSNMQLVQAGHCLESTSGMENELDPLRGGSRGDTLPSSALNSNTASFSDEQLVGSQDRLDGPIARSAGLSVGNCNQGATLLSHSDEFQKQKIGKNTASVGEHNPRSPVETSTHHAKKRRKILDEYESIKCMHLEGKKIFQEAEEKMYSLHNILLQSKLTEQIKKGNLPLSVSKFDLCGNFGCSSKKLMPSHESEVSFQQAGECNMNMDISPCFVETREHFQPLLSIAREEVKQNQDAGAGFEQIVNEDYMKLLDLDDSGAEERFRLIMEKPLSPILTELDLLEFGQEDGAHTQIVPLAGNMEATHNNLSDQNQKQLQFILFSDMEDIGSRTRVFCATRICVARCFSSPQKTWSVHKLLEALLLEKNLRPREKACVLFTLMLLNFSSVSSSKSYDLPLQEQIDSFSSHIRSVLFNSETRECWSKVCDLRDILSLSEDFILNKKIFSDNVPCELLEECDIIVEILHEGKKILLCSELASPDLVLAGSVVLASISKAVGHIGPVCDVSLKVLQIGRAEYSLALSILHTFAYICGEDYFTASNYSLIMKVVKSVVMFFEVSLAKNANMDLQPGKTLQHRFTPCLRCSFLDGCVSLNGVSLELLADLERHILPPNAAMLPNFSDSEALSCFLGDVMSSLELIGSIKGWDWAYEMMVPKLFKMLESSHQNMIFSTALVVLLVSLGRLGVEERGYDDAGVECVKHHLLGILSQTAGSKGNVTLPMTIVYGLIKLCPKGHEIFQKCNNAKRPLRGLSTSSDIVSNFLSSLGSEQLTSLASLVNNNLVIAA